MDEKPKEIKLDAMMPDLERLWAQCKTGGADGDIARFEDALARFHRVLPSLPTPVDQPAILRQVARAMGFNAPEPDE